METFSINELDLTRLIDVAIITNDKETLRAYRNVVQCIIEQHNYDYDICLTDKLEVTYMQVVRQQLDKLIDKIDKAS